MLFPERGVHASWSFFLLVLLAAVISPAEIVVSVLLAAALHECGHLGARRLSYGRELIVTLAGCGMNLLCGLVTAACALRASWVEGFVLAGAHILLAAFNLLPIPPLDGSRALYLVAALLFGPAVGDAAAAVTGLACALALVGTGIYIAAETGGGALFLLAALALLFGTLPQLRLAKRMRKV